MKNYNQRLISVLLYSCYVLFFVLFTSCGSSKDEIVLGSSTYQTDKIEDDVNIVDSPLSNDQTAGEENIQTNNKVDDSTLDADVIINFKMQASSSAKKIKIKTEKENNKIKEETLDATTSTISYKLSLASGSTYKFTAIVLGDKDVEIVTATKDVAIVSGANTFDLIINMPAGKPEEKSVNVTAEAVVSLIINEPPVVTFPEKTVEVTSSKQVTTSIWTGTTTTTTYKINLQDNISIKDSTKEQCIADNKETVLATKVFQVTKNIIGIDQEIAITDYKSTPNAGNNLCNFTLSFDIVKNNFSVTPLPYKFKIEITATDKDKAEGAGILSIIL